MRYLKNFLDKFNKMQSPEDIEKISNIRSEVNSIFYILKDDGFAIDIQYLKFREFKYFMITISDSNGLIKNTSNESCGEFLDRLQEVVDGNGLNLSFLDYFESGNKGGIIIIGSKNSPSLSSMRDLVEASRKNEIEPYETL